VPVSLCLCSLHYKYFKTEKSMKSTSSCHYGNIQTLRLWQRAPLESMSHSEKAMGHYALFSVVSNIFTEFFKQRIVWGTLLQALQLLSLPWSHDTALPQIKETIINDISTYNCKEIKCDVSSDSGDHTLQMPKVDVARKITKIIVKELPT